MDEGRFRSLLDKLEDIAESLGATVFEGPVPVEWQSPFLFTVGLSWKTRDLYVNPCTNSAEKQREEILVGLLHEMGHLFVGRSDPDTDGDEYRFLGWEYAVAKDIGMTRNEWLYGNSSYQVSDPTPNYTGSVIALGSLRGEEVDTVLAEIEDIAENRKYVKGGRPVYLSLIE
jgi:hypothetical protein